jgi:hypothetical protein
MTKIKNRKISSSNKVDPKVVYVHLSRHGTMGKGGQKCCFTSLKISSYLFCTKIKNSEQLS